MSLNPVGFTREALAQLEELYDFIADAGAPDSAAGFTESIVAFCEGLADSLTEALRAMTSAQDSARSDIGSAP